MVKSIYSSQDKPQDGFIAQVDRPAIDLHLGKTRCSVESGV